MIDGAFLRGRTAIVIDETQFALLVKGAAVCVMTPFTDVEIRLSPTKPYVRHGRPTGSQRGGQRCIAAKNNASAAISIRRTFSASNGGVISTLRAG